jgi:hypothetical protein
MATPSQTTYAVKVIATNTTYGALNKVTIPFEASRVTVSVIAASGSPDLALSLDGVNDSALLHHDKASAAGSYTFQSQRITTLYYKQSGTDCHFYVNAEMQSFPNIF